MGAWKRGRPRGAVEGGTEASYAAVSWEERGWEKDRWGGHDRRTGSQGGVSYMRSGEKEPSGKKEKRNPAGHKKQPLTRCKKRNERTYDPLPDVKKEKKTIGGRGGGVSIHLAHSLKKSITRASQKVEVWSSFFYSRPRGVVSWIGK